MSKEPDEPCMFDEIQMVVFARADNVGKTFRVLDENLRLCLICDEVFTTQGAAEHAERVCCPASQKGSPQGSRNRMNHKEEAMSLSKKYVRDGNRRIIGSVTTGFSDTSAVVRDEENKIAGRTSERFHTTRDEHANLLSINSPDPGLLLGRRK